MLPCEQSTLWALQKLNTIVYPLVFISLMFNLVVLFPGLEIHLSTCCLVRNHSKTIMVQKITVIMEHMTHHKVTLSSSHFIALITPCKK
jgi:hypothetical protein